MLIVLGFLLAQSSLAQDPPPAARPQEEESKTEFPINVNLWPVLESTTLPDGKRRTALWPLFHVTTLPKEGVHSWHVLNFLSGPNYHMFLPLYYSVDEHLGILPPLYLSGSDYWASFPLLSGSWWGKDSSRTTWMTPLFHLSTDPAGGMKSLHVGPYFQGEDYWAIPPTMTWQRTYESGDTATWITPMFHSTVDKDGDFVSMHVGPYFQGKDYWGVFPLISSSTDEDGATSTWITPLFHLATDDKGDVKTLLAGPYLGGKKWWSVWPLLMGGWEDGDGYRMTMGGVFCLKTDPEGLASASLCPIFTWDRESWCVFPLLSGHNKDVTWITPAFHRTIDGKGELESFHVGPYFQGKNYWMVPPLLSWQWKYEDNIEALWLTPLFHATWDSEGDVQSSHLFPAYLWKRDAYWAAPPLFSGSWSYADGSRTTWVTPFFHVTTDDIGDVDSLHLGPYFQGRNYWAVPPLFSWHVRRANGSETTWLTPLLHLSTDGNGDLESLHVLPAWFWERDRYWAIPPLLSGGGTHDDGASTTWITPIFHYTQDRLGEAESLHVLPAFFWKRDDYWVAPLLLSGGVTRRDGYTTRWFTPFYHESFTDNGTLRSRHALNYFEGQSYHHVMPVFWDWTAKDNIHHTMVLPPLFIRTEEPDGNVTTSLPWPLITARTGPSLDRSLGMELRPFLYQDAGEQYELNFLWRMFSVLSDEEATRVMVGPLWYSTRPNKPDAMSKFQILGGLFARDVNYETERYRYRLLWFIPFGSTPIRD